MISETNIRVRYSETDAMGVVYYGNYFVWFEVGRTEWLRQIGATYRQLETEGYFLPVVEAHCEYKSPAHYDDLLTITTQLSDDDNIYFDFHYQIICDSRLLVTGWTRHLCVDQDGRILRKRTKQLKNSLFKK
jgi:acyl-CoA thioester hydrolase